MSSITKPKRALLAYCALADRIQRSNAGMFGALAPFFAPICRDFADQMFDAAVFSDAVSKRYGLNIPRLAVLGMAEQLEAEGLLVSVTGKASRSVYQYARNVEAQDDIEAPGVSEREIDTVLKQFVDSCRSDPDFAGEDEQALHEAFFDRLLNADSMRLLARKEGGVGTKATAKTLSLKPKAPDAKEQRELRLDFHVAQFLIDLRDVQPVLFDRVSDIAFASMAAEALACFSEPASGTKGLHGLEIYLDSPLLLDMLGVNVDYAEYGKELLGMIVSSGATPAAFDDCIVEAESVVAAQVAALRSGANRAGHWGSSAKPYVLNALKGNVGSRASAAGIAVLADPQLDLMRRSKTTVGDVQTELSRRMAHWPNDEARVHDERSVWSMLRIRDANTPCTRICDSKAIFITRNTSLARAANGAWRIWLVGAAQKSQNVADRWAPVALSDKQLAGYLWLRSGAGNGTMSRARLLAHCSAAIRPRPDVKAKAYNLVLELHGQDQADHLAALLEDKEGERALMRATRADPEDVTPERLPHIIQQVKLAAGEFAAAAAREEGEQKLAAIQEEHQQELDRIARESRISKEESADQVKGLRDKLIQRDHEHSQLGRRVDALSQQLVDRQRSDLRSERAALEAGLSAGCATYRRVRIWFVVLFALVATLAMSFTDLEWVGQVISFAITAAGFWFVPEWLERPTCWIARRATEITVGRLEPRMQLPLQAPDFKMRTWDAIADLQRKLDALEVPVSAGAKDVPLIAASAEILPFSLESSVDDDRLSGATASGTNP